MLFKREETYDHEYMTMKEVMAYLPFSRSYLYELREKGVLHSIQEGTPNQPRYKYLTRSVLNIMANLDEHLRKKSKREADDRKERERRLNQLRKRYYAG